MWNKKNLIKVRMLAYLIMFSYALLVRVLLN